MADTQPVSSQNSLDLLSAVAMLYHDPDQLSELFRHCELQICFISTVFRIGFLTAKPCEPRDPLKIVNAVKTEPDMSRADQFGEIVDASEQRL